MTTRYHKDILRIAWPSILSNITVPLLGLVDLSIAGHLGAAYHIGAIAIGSTIFNMVYWIFSFLRMGTSGMTSQAFGAGNVQEIRLLLCRSTVTALGISFIILCLQSPLLRLALAIMSPTDAVLIHASTYFHICIWGAPAVLCQYSLTGWFIGLQNARYPLYVAIVQNIANIAGSLFFVFALHMDVAGIALGTLVAQYCGLFLSVILCLRMRRKLSFPQSFPLSGVFDKRAIRRFFSVNRDIFLRTLCLVSVTLYFTSSGAQRGEIILAVNALLMQYFTLYSYFMDGFAFAGEALSGQCAGANDRTKLQSVVRDLFLWGGGVALLFTFFYAIAGSGLLGLLTNETQVIRAAGPYLPWAIAIPFAGLAAFTWDGVFIGLTATRYMLISMSSAMLVFFSSYYLLSPYFANHALWLAFLLYLVTRGAVQHLLYQKKILSLRNNPNLTLRQ